MKVEKLSIEMIEARAEHTYSSYSHSALERQKYLWFQLRNSIYVKRPDVIEEINIRLRVIDDIIKRKFASGKDRQTGTDN